MEKPAWPLDDTRGQLCSQVPASSPVTVNNAARKRSEIPSTLLLSVSEGYPGHGPGTLSNLSDGSRKQLLSPFCGRPEPWCQSQDWGPRDEWGLQEIQRLSPQESSFVIWVDRTGRSQVGEPGGKEAEEWTSLPPSQQPQG